MATYGILRVEKLKKLTNLKGSLMHAFREQDTPNADPARKGQNILLTPDANNVESTMAKYEQLKPKEGKIRSDVVHALEVLVTASPEKIRAMNTEERNAYFNDALRFCNAKFGEGNLLHAQIHNDETTAHLTAFYIPVIEKRKKNGEVSRRLNASSYLGGKKEFSARQSEFYEQVSKKYGMERGEIGSKATHKKVLDWYKELNAEELSGRVEQVIEALQQEVQEQVTVEVDEAELRVLGFAHGTKKTRKSVKLPQPLVSLPSVRDVLKPFENRNSELKRREKAAYKEEVRKEVEEEVRSKFVAREAVLAEKEAKAKKALQYVIQFYKVVAEKLGVNIAGQSGQDIRKSIIEQAEKNGNLARNVESLTQFKKSVDDEIARWTYTGTGKRAYSNFDEYTRDFEKQHREIARLKNDKEQLHSELNAVKSENSSLISFKERVSHLVNDFFDSSLEKTVEALVNIANKFSNPNFIKEKYEEQCQRMISENAQYVMGQLNKAMAHQSNIYNARCEAFVCAHKKMIEIDEYTNGRIPDDWINAYKEAKEKLDKDKHLLNMPKMKM